jgi:hypothetical protein
MLKALVVAAALLVVQKPESTSLITGTVVLPPLQKPSRPVQVILLSSQYMNLWNSDVQKRLDVYWETYKPAFASQKDFFFEISKQAHREATNYVLTRMRRDPSSNLADYLKETSPDGTFEFKNVPFGEYKVLAIGRIGDQDVMWQEFVDVRSSVPQFVEMKKRVP